MLPAFILSKMSVSSFCCAARLVEVVAFVLGQSMFHTVANHVARNSSLGLAAKLLCSAISIMMHNNENVFFIISKFSVFYLCTQYICQQKYLQLMLAKANTRQRYSKKKKYTNLTQKKYHFHICSTFFHHEISLCAIM